MIIDAASVLSIRKLNLLSDVIPLPGLVPYDSQVLSRIPQHQDNETNGEFVDISTSVTNFFCILTCF